MAGPDAAQLPAPESALSRQEGSRDVTRIMNRLQQYSKQTRSNRKTRELGLARLASYLEPPFGVQQVAQILHQPEADQVGFVSDLFLPAQSLAVFLEENNCSLLHVHYDFPIIIFEKSLAVIILRCAYCGG